MHIQNLRQLNKEKSVGISLRSNILSSQLNLYILNLKVSNLNYAILECRTTTLYIARYRASYLTSWRWEKVLDKYLWLYCLRSCFLFPLSLPFRWSTLNTLPYMEMNKILPYLFYIMSFKLLLHGMVPNILNKQPKSNYTNTISLNFLHAKWNSTP